MGYVEYANCIEISIRRQGNRSKVPVHRTDYWYQDSIKEVRETRDTQEEMGGGGLRAERVGM